MAEALPLHREERMQKLRSLSVETLVNQCDSIATVAITLGDQLATIAELLGMDRNSEDLAVVGRVEALVRDVRVREVLDEAAAVT
ncbi:hypothetical protein [Mycobacteroides abscessus]|uniref:hypothetical protein n=1 Tax=Mycobacteroides abscessus TaxID=36809 RepID=UPI0012FFD3A8|nr:hypothetical protein [Mycobacteroides abscessus]